MDKKAILLIGDGVSATDLRYASGFSAPDNFIFMQSGSRKICAVSALEYNVPYPPHCREWKCCGAMQTAWKP